MGKRAFFISGEANQTFRVSFQFLQRRSRLVLFAGAKFCGGDQAADVLISRVRLDQQGAVAFGNSDFRADVGLNPAFPRRVKTRRP